MVGGNRKRRRAGGLNFRFAQELIRSGSDG